MCSLTSDAPPEECGVRTGNLSVAANAAQLEQLAELVAAAELELQPEPVVLAEAPEPFARVTAGAQLVLTF